MFTRPGWTADSDSEDDIPAIVIDNGSGDIKGGFSGDDAPRSVFNNLVGLPKHDVINGAASKSCFVGDNARARSGVLTFEWPINKGIVQNWDHMESVWHHLIYHDLCCAPEEHPILVTEVPQNPKSNREKMQEVLFEAFNAPKMYVAQTAICAACSIGRGLHALYVDVGDTVSYTYPIFEGQVLEHSIQRIDLGGRDVTNYLARMLNQRKREFNTSSSKLTVNEIKEKLCYISRDFGPELLQVSPRYTTFSEPIYELIAEYCGVLNPDTTQYILPDGRTIECGVERFLCPEILFRPSLIGREEPGLAEMIINTINASPIDTRRDLCGNINIIGGSTLFSNFGDRIQSDVAKLSPQNRKVRPFCAPERKWMQWIGASILSSLSTFSEDNWVSQAMYREYGSSAVHRWKYTKFQR